MSRFVQYTEKANHEIMEIFDYLDQRDETVANRFYDAVEQTVRQLARSPYLGERCQFRSPQTKGMRIWQVSGFSNYLIFYQVGKTDLTVVRVIHGARDYAAMFNEE